ncbi:MAG: hypothetical protein IJ593_09995 [Lachnospiraceae bacterium]|nr:hypothetical protein [Lachnospiraceae bacterium]
MESTKNKYVVDKVVFARRDGPDNIPYFYYAVLKDNNGNRVICDEVNMERLMNKDGYYMDAIMDVSKYAARKGVLKYLTLKDDEYANLYDLNDRIVLEEDKFIKDILIRQKTEVLFSEVYEKFEFNEGK